MKRRVAILVVVLIAAGFASGCNGGNGEEDTTLDIDIDENTAADDVMGEDAEDDVPDGDMQAEDIGEEEPPLLPEGYCRACTYDSDCGPGGVCIHLDDGEMGCGIPCELPTDCPADSRCDNVPESDERQCVPSSGSCVWNSIGSPCPSWGCSGRNDLCSDPEGEDGYCTHWCENRVDCEPGFMQCVDRGDGVMVCMKDPPPPFERCGISEHTSGVGSPCGSATCSDPEFVCADTLDASLPRICVRSCTIDADCPEDEGAQCVNLPGTPPDDRYCVSNECRCLGIVPGSLLDELLEGAGLTRCKLAWDDDGITEYFGPDLAHDRFRISWTDDVHNDWLRAVPKTYEIEGDLDNAASLGIAQVIVSAAGLSQHPIAGGDTTFSPAALQPLAVAVSDLVTSLGEVPDITGYEADAADVPEDVQVFAARIIMAITAAIQARNDALAVLEGDSWKINHYYLRAPFLILPSTSIRMEVTDRQVQDFLIGDFNYEIIYQAAYDIAHNVEMFAAEVSAHPPDESFSFSQSTPAGRIEISDGGDTSYVGAMTSADYLLVLDVGGNDEYEISAGANSSGDNPVSILIDFSGEDTYAYHVVPDPNDGDRLPSDSDGRMTPTADRGPYSLSKIPRQGSGRLGIGMLFDFGSMDDRYRSLRISQGSGILGVGLLYDDGGSENYECENVCQGGGAFGLGILIDAGSPGAAPGDSFSSYHASQGFAFAGAVGILYNGEGNDTYFCNQDDILYPSPQSDVSNSSLCQGMGFGRRADEWLGGDGVFMSGGIGILRDLSGDDHYTAAVFGQGCGYWFGFGFLLDGDGSDVYNARYYAQGSTAHYATSVLLDSAGDDFYNRDEVFRLAGVLGAGHDFSSSFLIDGGGHDLYFSPGRSLGTGNDNAFGILIDREGDDAYQCNTDYSFGNANMTPEMELTRGVFPTVGMFLDCNGTDTYDRPDTSIMGNDTTWQQKRHPDSSSETGLGGDTSTQPCGI